MNIEQLNNYIPVAGKILWVIEEGGTLPPHIISPFAERSQVLCNRIDLYKLYEHVCPCTLSDFKLSDTGFSAVVFYISKERLISNYVIASSSKWLHETGTLIIVGRKNEGIKNYFGKLKAQSPLKKQGEVYIGTSHRPVSNSEHNKHISDYDKLISLEAGEIQKLYSKAGIFSWKKVDQGSLFLSSVLKEEQVNFTGKSVMDLGCGNGYLTLFSALLGAEKICATDNNITAIQICERNMEEHAVPGRAVIADCANEIAEKFDTVICNPPFHKGKNIESELTEKFVVATKRVLKRDGEAWFVVNAFIAIEKLAQTHFKSVKMVANNKQFKVIQLRQPL